MVSKRKVRLMTQLAIYESRTGKEDIKLAGYFKSDYARLNVLKTAILVTIAFAMALGMVALYRLEYLLDNALTLDYKAMGWTILGTYIGVMAVYLIFSLLGYSLKYQYSRAKLGKYYKMLGKLRKMDEEEEEGINPDDYSEEGEEQ